MDGPQDRIAIMYKWIKIFFIQAQVKGDGPQQLVSGCFECAIGLEKHGRKVYHLCDGYIRRILLADGIIIHYGLTELKELFQVRILAAFCMFFPERSISALTGQLRYLIFLFYVQGQ